MRERSKYDLKPFSIIDLKFLDKIDIPSKKTYEYYLDEEMTNYFKSFNLNSTSFVIVNEKGYNYRDSEVIVHYWREIPIDVRDGLVFITSAKKKRNKLSPKIQCYDGSTPFNKKKEIEMIFTNSTVNELLTTLSNIADAAKTATATATANDSLNTFYTSTIHFDSKGITISDDTELNLNYEKVYDILEEVKEEKNRKESKKMFENVMKNFKFGPCGPKVKMSMYGPAFISEDNTYIAFDADNEPIDVTGMTFDFNCMYMMPVGVSDVCIDDYIYHKNKPVKVVDVTERGSFVCIDVFNKEEITVIPIKSPFGFNFLTKLVNFGEGIFEANTIDEANPFGSTLPFMMMSQNKGGNDNMMLMALMMGQNKIEMNPMMMYALLSDNKSNDIFPLMMMFQNTHKCKCGDN